MSLRLSTAPGRWVLTAAVLGSGVVSLDATVVNVALPTIGTDLDADLAGLTWTVNGYALTLAALILLGGSLGDRFGRRRVFVFGVAWFGAASLLCGIAPNLEVLVLARALQGVGGALLTPGSLAMISASFHPDDRARAIGAWSGLGGIAGAIGPLVGGVLIDLSWRWVFLINLPLCLAVVLIALRHVPESLDDTMPPGLDLTGSLTAALGLAGLTYALIAIPDGGLSAAALPLLLGVAGLVAFVLVERRSRHPLVPLDIFASRQFTATNVVTFALYAALGVIFFLLSVVLQITTGMTPLQAGAALLPITALMLALSSRAGALAARIGPRRPMTFGPLIVAAALLLLLRIGPDSTYFADVLPPVIVLGLGLSLFVAPLTATVLAAAEDRHAGVASGVNNAVARTAGLLAVAVLPLVMGIGGEEYRDPAALADGFHRAMLASAGLVALSALIAWFGVSDDVLDAKRAEVLADGPPADADEARVDLVTVPARDSQGHPYSCAICVPPALSAGSAPPGPAAGPRPAAPPPPRPAPRRPPG